MSLLGRLDFGQFWRKVVESWLGNVLPMLLIVTLMVICRRGGMTPSCPGGQDWEPALGGGWKQVTARGATC